MRPHGDGGAVDVGRRRPPGGRAGRAAALAARLLAKRRSLAVPRRVPLHHWVQLHGVLLLCVRRLAADASCWRPRPAQGDRRARDGRR
eukprot:3736204-Prymnesium_polylepis.1